MSKLTAAALFDYANAFARAAEAAGKATVYPTVREAARKFGTTQGAIEEVVLDYYDSGYLGLIVGFKNGNGYATYKNRGDCQVEAYAE